MSFCWSVKAEGLTWLAVELAVDPIELKSSRHTRGGRPREPQVDGHADRRRDSLEVFLDPAGRNTSLGSTTERHRHYERRFGGNPPMSSQVAR